MIYKGFKLDRFQEEAIYAIEQHHSVIVTAPTGAGKTVIAEYVVEKCIRLGRRVIYTAPIKALSNQKYRDFYQQYGDAIGIVTGDVTLNASAQVLLMTTEIFRNAIFDDITRLEDIEYVIFDEIHYINDIERGTVWEESIIFAPQHIKFVCLSATIPNIVQFAEWMRSVREERIEVVEDTERPVPLEHHLYLEGYGIGNIGNLRGIQDEIAYTEFHNQSVDEIVASKYPEIISADLIQHIRKNHQLPCLYFCFSRKGCVQNAEYYANHNFLSPKDRDEILRAFDSLCARYNIHGEKNIDEFRNLVSKGVVYHHAGMLPTLKEVVEHLFASGRIQLLFTTETFAVGINMPVCTAVFDSLEKYDGVNFRYLKAREYHQMAGRAGRRGIDTVGYVYAQVNPRFADHNQIQRIISGEIEAIESQFNLSYSSILNLYEKYGDDIYDVCTSSLSNFQNYERISEIELELKGLKTEFKGLPHPECIHDGIDASQQISGYSRLLDRLEESSHLLRMERAEAKRKQRGRGNQKLRLKKLARIKRQLRSIEFTKRENLCCDCQQLKLCFTRHQKIEKSADHIRDLQDRRAYYKNYQRNQIANRLKVLEKLGYIDESGLLPRGGVASQIYGYEIQITQLLFSGFFEDAVEDQINLLIMAIVCESRKDLQHYRKLKDKRLIQLLREVDSEIEHVRALERKYRVVEEIPKLETKLSTAILAWSHGCEFEDLHQYVNLADGDFVRSFRLVIDLLRQMRRAMVGHNALLEKLGRCIDKINRDVVDAERQLRIGQNGQSTDSNISVNHNSVMSQ